MAKRRATISAKKGAEWGLGRLWAAGRGKVAAGRRGAASDARDLRAGEVRAAIWAVGKVSESDGIVPGWSDGHATAEKIPRE